ncbi:MAG: hypothetical protein IRZ00_14795 [Gemmatimonadetes bacterium]|nr:hypothetical protein [Gemmatimonadota bacterium]
MLDARDYAVVELDAGEAAKVAGGAEVGDLADTLGYAIGYLIGSIYAFVTQPSVGTWKDWHS